MKVICHREGLLSACQLVSVAVASKDVNPVLRNLKAVVEPDRLTLLATDTEVGVRMEVRSVKVDEPGEALWPAARIVSILREATDEELTIESSPAACLLRGESAEFEMPGEDPAVYPDFPTFTEDKYHEVAAGVLRTMIHRTTFAVADDNARYTATKGVLWELSADSARLVGTDGKRMAVADGAAKAHDGHGTAGQSPVVPIKAMTLLERSLNEPDEMIRIGFRPNEVLIKLERSVIYSRLVEGRFPNYKQVIPQKHGAKVKLIVGPFQTALRQAAIMVDEESKRVGFAFTKNKLTLQARGAGAGRSRVEMPVAYDGKPLEINFDPKSLLDMLRVLEPDAELTLELNDSTAPVVFRNDAGDYLYVVAPVVVKDQAGLK